MVDDTNFKANYMEGLTKFERARGRAFWEDALSLFRGKSTELLSFEDVRTRLRLREENYKGLQDVPLDKIVGSVGRYTDFTGTFLPKSGDMKERWSRVYAQANSLEGLPPIELYKVGDVYFVRDGNHRVSVARTQDFGTIQAHVTELPTSVNLHAGMSVEDLDVVAAYAEFLEETGLKKTRPNHESIELSEPSRYHDILGHIYLHAQVMEQYHGRLVSMKEAAADWYDYVYRPALTLIRKHDVLKRVSSKVARTEADMYVWLVDHLREVRRQYGTHEPPTRRFSDALVQFLREQKIDVPEELLEEDDRTVLLTRGQVMRAVNKERERLQQEQEENDNNSDE